MLGNLKPQRATDRIVQYFSQWTIGASGAHTKTTGVPGTGFASVAETAAGKYTITFSDVAIGGLIGLQLIHWPAADAEPLILAPTDDVYSASAKTAKYEAWAIDETAAQTEIPSGDKVTIIATFLETK